jgi:hypothetical protein
MATHRHCLSVALFGILFLALASLPARAWAWDMAGTKTITLHGRDGKSVQIGFVTFAPKGERTAFSIRMNTPALTDHFLSMREFKCIEGSGEILCHVPYPYDHPATVSITDFAWLEHALLFLYKLPKDFGAKWWNGVYYRLKLTDQGLVGLPEAIDLNQISAPHADLSVPPYGPDKRSEMAPGARWFDKLTIE